MRGTTIALAALAALLAPVLSGCFEGHGPSGPTDMRPRWSDCDRALESADHMDECTFDGECGRNDGGPEVRRAALCANERLLLVEMVESSLPGAEDCSGTFSEEADAFLSLAPAEVGCLDVTLCSDDAGVRRVALCQDGALLEPSEGVAAWTACEDAVADGTDGDPCNFGGACMRSRVIRGSGADVGTLPVFGWCDAGILRLGPTQTALHAGL
ncbi:MAG TPA: hypothetical protein RMH99_28140 [Sandaracinaceae bacterium LLY-WYZ-13_1]|nr:hypothetical protein [Sandaracinaceae bacterium LLY-WYZ-13_1]